MMQDSAQDIRILSSPVDHLLKMWKSLTLKSLYRSALAGRPGLAGRVLAGWGWPAWAVWVVVRFWQAGWLVCWLVGWVSSLRVGL